MPLTYRHIYWKCPYAIKCFLASLHARRLDRVRYGPRYERICQEIRKRDTWTEVQFSQYQRERLQELFKSVLPHVSYYRSLFREYGIDPDGIRSPEDLDQIPILEKAAVQKNPRAFLDERLNPKKLIVLHTSGTTGTPLVLYRDAALNAAAFAYLDERWHATAGVRRRDHRSVSIGGHLVAEVTRTQPPFWVENRRWQQLYMSSYHLSSRHLRAYVKAIREFQCDYVEGYPSSLYSVARLIVDEGLDPIGARACFTTAETLLSHQRETIQDAFGCAVYDQYGCGEMAVFAAECDKGAMHLSPEFGIMEVLDENDRPVPPGNTGEFVCTSLINRTQPFVRYRLGDRGSLRAGRCSCGSSLPMLGHVEGRTDSVLLRRDGRRIGRLDSVFKDAANILEAQIVQDDWDVFRVRIVPSSGYSRSDGNSVLKALEARVGGGVLRVEVVERIERSSAGKFAAVVCNLPAGSKRLALGCRARGDSSGERS